VRDFTLLSEQLSPDRIVRILNAYLNVVAQAVEEFDGTITQFQGDNLIAVFNMSDDQPDHALQAVKAAITLQRAVANYQTQQPPNEPRLHFGVGINTGTALIGNIGAHQRYSYTAVGDAVNLAARITSVAPANKIWLSQATYSQLKNAVVVEPLPPLTFKGKRQPTRLFQVQVPPS
jgi:adenylate cyclase